MIPADCRILSAKDLFVSQAAMTGESMPVEKYALQHSMDVNSPLELDNLVFMGTNVVSGTAKAVVLNTGIQTYFGALAHRLLQPIAA
jgi:Mg2+-importing ATPase